MVGLLSAQDIIVKKDGSIIKAKVLELTETCVIYKSFTNPEGPSYSIKIENILSLTYENGEEEKFKNSSVPPDVSESKSQKPSSDMSDAILLSRIADLEAKADHIETIGKWVGVLGILGLLAGDVIIFGDNEGLALGVGIPVGMLWLFGEISLFNSICDSYTRQAAALKKELKGSLSFSPTLIRNNMDGSLGAGIALSLKF